MIPYRSPLVGVPVSRDGERLETWRCLHFQPAEAKAKMWHAVKGYLALDLCHPLRHRPTMPHRFSIRVYYEDTDLAGIVYYANYLKFIERARTEWVRSQGIDQTALKRDEGIVFAVRRVEADYLSPAQFDDLLTVETAPIQIGGARIVLSQSVLRGALTLFQSKVTLAALTETGKPARLSQELRGTFSSE